MLGIGVTEEDIFTWMEHLSDALNIPESSNGIRGLRFRMSDDGSVILP